MKFEITAHFTVVREEFYHVEAATKEEAIAKFAEASRDWDHKSSGVEFIESGDVVQVIGMPAVSEIEEVTP